MKILMLEWKSFGNEDIIDAFSELGHSVVTIPFSREEVRDNEIIRNQLIDDIKKENVTPNGSPVLVKPIKSGIDEQEQKGVTVPSNAAIQLAPIPWNLSMIFLLFSGGK